MKSNLIATSICLWWLATVSILNASIMSYDNRAFLLNGERTLLVGCALRSPHNSSASWSGLIKEAKASGINLVQVDVHWDTHEPREGHFNFPSDGSTSDIVALVRECTLHEIYVNLKLGPFFSTERSSDGFPDWLRAGNANSTEMLTRWGRFVDETLAVMTNAGLLANVGGPVLLLQIDNVCGRTSGTGTIDNIQSCHDWVSNFVGTRNLTAPWIMPMPVEGVKVRNNVPIVHGCGGYNCEDWHANNFTDMPLVLTDNSIDSPQPGGADEAFALARWYATGGSYSLETIYFDARGDQINSYGLRDETKFSLLRQLRDVLQFVAPVLLAHTTLPSAVVHATYHKCETITYEVPVNANIAARKVGNVSFLSNRNRLSACTFELNGVSYVVPAWSVSIIGGGFPDGPKVLINTLTAARGDQQ